MSCYIPRVYIPGSDTFSQKVRDHFRPEWSFIKMPFFQNSTDQYPSWLFPEDLTFELEPITIFYGGNGSGKSTLLNLIAKKLDVKHRSHFNKSKYFDLFAHFCEITMHSDFDDVERRCDIITSDDVFQHCFKVRQTNLDISARQTEAINTKVAMLKGTHSINPLQGMEDLERFEKDLNMRERLKKSKGFSGYLEKFVGHTLCPASNGETALKYFTSALDSAGVYLLDEPENSMSPAFQMKLIDFLENSARFFGMQFIIATHSPLVLGMKYAKIYNLDEEGAPERQWSELENIRILRDYFTAREKEFSHSETKEKENEK